MSTNSDNHEGESKTSREEDWRLRPEVPPTKSLLTSKAWVEDIKHHIKAKPLRHEELVGPFFRESAPYRAKISPPHENGTILVIKGRVWSYNDKTPLCAAMDVWQADVEGRYDNEEPARSVGELSFINRARVRCDEDGYYEFETVHPGAYQRGATWHAPHIHFRIMYSGYVTCVTQLLFKNDPHVNEDPFREHSEIIDLEEKAHYGRKYQEGVFNIVLIQAPQETKLSS